MEASRRNELPPPKSRLPLEVEFRRLLQRCEEIVEGDCKGREDLQDWATSPSFHASVDLLQEQIADLSNIPQNRIDQDVVESYHRHVSNLVKKLKPISVPAFIRAEQRAENRKNVPPIQNPVNVPSTSATNSVPSEVRQRSNVTLKGPLQQDTKERLQRQANLQDDLTDEMVALAAGLRRNAQAMRGAVQRREGILNETENAIEESLVRAKKSSKQSSALKVKGSISICTFILLAAITCVIVAFVYLFIKGTSFLGYKRRPK